MTFITSPANQLVKDLVALKKAAKRKKKDLIIVDGEREVAAACASGWPVEKLFICEKLFKKGGVAGRYFGLSESQLVSVTAEIFHKISYKDNPDGFLATIKPREIDINEVKLSNNPLIIVLEAVEKPGNIGAIIRTAAATGVDLIIINSSQTDLYNPNVIRASEGEIFSQKLVKMSVSETVLWLRTNNIRSFGALTDGSTDYTKADLSSKAAIVLGSEADGLSSEWRREVDERIKIPMAGKIDSLNVSVATAVITFEALRQRKKGEKKRV